MGIGWEFGPIFSLRTLFGGKFTDHNRAYIRNFSRLPDLVYVIGDVHGCLEQLHHLEAQISQDRQTIGMQASIIMLGDYVDRGPQSAQTLDHLIAPPPENFTRICLMGNHELAMLQFLESAGHNGTKWLDFGGHETLNSYGISQEQISKHFNIRQRQRFISSNIPAQHLNFLRTLPHALNFPKHIFVHAGLRPGIALKQQTKHDLLSIRKEFHAFAGPWDKFITHGHTPVAAAERTEWRLNVDTGAYATGTLSAAKFVSGKLADVFST